MHVYLYARGSPLYIISELHPMQIPTVSLSTKTSDLSYDKIWFAQTTSKHAFSQEWLLRDFILPLGKIYVKDF